MAQITTSYSSWRLFLTCQRAYQWRYIRQLEPIHQPHALVFGKTFHAMLEHWHKHRDLDATLDQIDRAYPNRKQNPSELRDHHMATAMMRGYARRYAEESFKVVGLEIPFDAPLVDPKTRRAHVDFRIGGVIDGIVEMPDGHYLMEHKTAATIDSAYLEKLWNDLQLIMYAYFAEHCLGYTIRGVIYNVVVKAKLQQKQGETKAEFEARRSALAAKNKSGKTSAKRKEPESNDEFLARLTERYETDPNMYHREIILVGRDQFRELEQELWQLTQAYEDAKRREFWIPNRASCFRFGRPCDYLPLCKASGSDMVAENLYQPRGTARSQEEKKLKFFPTNSKRIF